MTTTENKQFRIKFEKRKLKEQSILQFKRDDDVDRKFEIEKLIKK